MNKINDEEGIVMSLQRINNLSIDDFEGWEIDSTLFEI